MVDWIEFTRQGHCVVKLGVDEDVLEQATAPLWLDQRKTSRTGVGSIMENNLFMRRIEEAVFGACRTNTQRESSTQGK